MTARVFACVLVCRTAFPALSAVIVFLCVPLMVSAAQAALNQGPGAAEAAVRTLVRALAMRDARAFQAITLPHPRAARLLNAEPLTDEGRAEAERRLESLQVRLEDDFLLRGAPVSPDVRGDYPVGTVGHAIAAGQGGPMAVRLVREAEGWKVDVRWWVAMLDAATSSAPPSQDSPDSVVRQFLLAMIALDREEALRHVVPDVSPDVLFAGAPRQREPSGVLEAAAMEMPLVQVGPGEFYRLPSGRVVEGQGTAERTVVVGQFGPVEMPFVLRQIDGRWRVEAEPYYALINQ
jgi:hypothetical protein